MSLFSKKNIKTAIGKKGRINLSSRVVTTNDFGYCLPIFARETVPGDVFNFDISSFCRLDPMPVPSFTNIRITNHAFYVKFKDVWKPWEDFFVGREFIDSNGIKRLFNEVPHLTNYDLIRAFVGEQEEEYLVTKTFDMEHCDFYLGVNYGYNFTDKGRKFYTLLCNLGYKINWSLSDTTKFSSLPLLCYAKAYYDYVVPSRFSHSHPLRKIFSEMGPSIDVLNAIADTFSSTYYDNDYFTASWLTPNNPQLDNSKFGYVEVVDPAEPDNASVYRNHEIENGGSPNSGNVVAATAGLPNGVSSISAWQMYMLNALYKFGMRRGLAGNKYFEQIFANFGIKLPSIQNERCQYLGSDTFNVQISDVTSQSTTQVGDDVSRLGDYAGKGIAYNSSDIIKAECDDYGMIIVLSTVLPETGYTQGRNREIMHLDRMDFYLPDFDGVGMQAVRNDELFAMSRNAEDYYNGLSYGGRPDGIFGYVPRFAEYKKGYDILSGDFIVPHLNIGLDSYHTFRQFANPSQQNPLANVEEFRMTNNEFNGNKFNRIFYSEGLKDHFTFIIDVNCHVLRNMRSLTDSIEFEHDNGFNIEVDNDKTI